MGGGNGGGGLVRRCTPGVIKAWRLVIVSMIKVRSNKDQSNTSFTNIDPL